MAELEYKLAERELSGLLPEENWSERHSAKTGTNVDKNPGTMTEANPRLVSFHGVFGNSDLSIRAVFPISSASSHAFAPTLKETTMWLPTYMCSSISSLVCMSLHVTFLFLLSMSASASLFQAVHSYASTLPVSLSHVFYCSPTFMPSLRDPRVSPLHLALVFLVILVFHVPLRVILSHILMLTPFQRTSTLLVQCTLTPHKAWVWLPRLITPLCSTILVLVLKLILLSLKTHVTFHLLFSQWMNVLSQPLLPHWRKWVPTKACRCYRCSSLMAPLRDIHYSDRGSTRWRNRKL